MIIQRGFTLIELMLVVAIMGAMATFVIPMYRQRMQTFKIDKTAIEMQQVLQASTSYWMQNNHQWPGKANVCSATKVFNNNYVPMHGLTDPWGGAICYAPNNANLFDVVATVPNEALALRIAARLPNAAAGYDNNHHSDVIAEIASPGSTGKQNQGYMIKRIGTFTSGETPSISFTCPVGWKGNVVTAIDTALIPFKQNKTNELEKLQPATVPTAMCLAGNKNNQHSCRISSLLSLTQIKAKQAKVSISYIAFCIPPKRSLVQLGMHY